MTAIELVSGDAWAFTDIEGRIESISAGARQVLGSRGLGRGDDLLVCFPLPRKALLTDMASALSGWPSRRAMILERPATPALSLEYRVSRRFEMNSGEGLFWRLCASPLRPLAA